jgi:lambda repressor-like predicted transcriptional regulator
MGIYTDCMDSTAYAAAVAANIETAMKKSGRNLHSLSQETGISRTTLDRRFKSEGASAFTVREIKAIARALDTTARDLVTVYEVAEKVAA